MNEKMIKTANGLYKFFKVLEKCMVAAGIVLVIVGIMLPFFAKSMTSPATTATFGPLEMVLTNPIEDAFSDHILLLEGAMVAGIAMAVASWLTIRILCDIIAPMKEGKPFEAGASKKIKNLGIMTLILGALSQLLECAITTVTFLAYEVETLVDGSAVMSVNYDYHFDIKFVLVALVIFLLSYVFKYGEELQREADETL